jgi:RNA polymerase II-associated factor 1
LLRPIAALGRRKAAEANVSFLRRTEYISNLASKRFESGSPRALLNTSKKNVRRPVEEAADSPQAIKRKIDRSFEVAEQELKNYKRVKHPSKRNVELVDATPLVPDLESFPDSGAFVTIKFGVNPVPSAEEYDKRLLASIFKPIDRTEEEEAAYEAALEAHVADPENNPKPQNFMNYDFFLPQSARTADHFRRKFDVDNPDREDDSLYTHKADTGGCFQFNRIRAYETTQETELDHPTKYTHEILLAYNDTDDYPKQKAFYYYPVLQKSTIRPQRTKNIARTIGFPEEEEKIVEQMDVTVDDPNDSMRDRMKQYKENPLGFDEDEEEEQGAGAEQPRAQSEDAEGDEDAHVAREQSSPDARPSRSYAEDDDDDDE